MSNDRLTEILNYLSAISREIGAFRTETQARFEQVENRLEAIETEMKAGFEAVRTDIRLLKRQFEVMTQDLMEVRRDQRDLEVRMEALESKQA
jgi:BMFP domain-containing protein YqiC